VDDHRRKVDEALRRAREIAGECGAPETEPLHLFIAVCESVDTRLREVWARLGRGQAATSRQLRETLPCRDGRPAEKLSADVETLVDSAGRIARRRGVATAEPVDLLEEMATHPTAAIARALESAGLAIEELRRAVTATAPTEHATTVLPPRAAASSAKSFEAILSAAEAEAVDTKDRFTLPVHLLIALAGTPHPSVIEAFKLARRLLAQPSLAAYVAEEILPGPDCQSDAQILEQARELGNTAHHPVGTCRMGTDDQSVVDARLRVRGFEALRVADGSIMPYLVSGNTNAPIVMIAEKASDMIAEDLRA